MWKTTTVILILSIGLYNLIFQWELKKPDLPETFWGPEKNKAASKNVRPFKVDVPKSVIDDLNKRLENPRLDVEPLEGVAWTYGVPAPYLKKIITYWHNKYNWTERQSLLNKYPQFVTNIQGLDIHFYHVKPSNLSKDRKIKVLPLLLVHGWPGSVVEFQKIIPLLTTPRPNKDFVFELVIPSLPGYGFSDGAVRPGLAPAHMGIIFKNLMTRLGFEKYYVQGGDWGAVITSSMAALYPEKILGLHSNMCVHIKPLNFWNILGVFFPSLIVNKQYEHKVYPLTNYFYGLMEETGYLHLQATKPDTIGLVLTNSPISLAGYILEKFSTGTNPEYRIKEDGGLLEKFTLDELLDNIMIYWVTDSITTSARIYAEQFTRKYWDLKIDELPIDVPSACAVFPGEFVYTTEKVLRTKYLNLIQFNHMPKGGHFAAMEESIILADDIFEFFDKIVK
ncbi:juvenile hormone epoxide hydrolase 1-like [Vespa velutina]|uniref:juvenile hormone epoxide hydrolase 1-like n=1 Tax=Vespa velutina TaxID=202808 RepID=UPI001FB268AC|nr:juvenile hormone epoxide hydrolase 1-like [Vespa velutina]